MIDRKRLASAATAVALLGAAAFAALISVGPSPGSAAAINTSARAALTATLGSPNQELTVNLRELDEVKPGASVALIRAIVSSPNTTALAAALDALAAGDPSVAAALQRGQFHLVFQLSA